MDRRSFFKLIGAAIVAPFFPKKTVNPLFDYANGLTALEKKYVDPIYNWKVFSGSISIKEIDQLKNITILDLFAEKFRESERQLLTMIDDE